MSFLDCFSIPAITIVDSMGMKVSTAPQGELARNAAQLLSAMTQATNVRVALIAGNAVGMSYAALASRAASDVVYAWPGAVVSAVTPKIAAQLNYEDELKSAEDPYSKREELEKRYMDDVADGRSEGLCRRCDRACADAPDARGGAGDALRQARSQSCQKAWQYAAVRRKRHE